MLCGSHENVIKTVQLLWLPLSKRAAYLRTGANLFDDHMRKKTDRSTQCFLITCYQID